MSDTWKIGLGAAIGLAAAVALVAAIVWAADGDDGDWFAGQGMSRNDHVAGMMGSMADMDNERMLEHMQQVLGDEAYVQMLEHMTDHRSTPMMGGESIDAMMHQMMDGMMDHMYQSDPEGMPNRHGDHHQNAMPQ